MNSMPLKGKIVVVTRSQDKQAEAKNLFKQIGANVLDLPALVIGPPNDWEPLDKALLKCDLFNWIVFSSSNGVKFVDERLRRLGDSLESRSKKLKIAAVGKKTASFLKSIGVTPDFVPSNFIAESLIQEFPFEKNDLNILLPRVQSGGRSFLAKSFRNRNAKVLEVPAYESCCPKDIPLRTLDVIRNSEVDAIVFTSGKTVIHTIELLNNSIGQIFYEKLKCTKIISIGPQTSLACKKYFDRVDEEASPHDLDGLIQATINALNDQ